MTDRHQSADDEVLIDLVIRYLDSELQPHETHELSALLAGDPHNRAVFVEVCLQAKLCAETLGNRLHDAAANALPLPTSGPIPIDAEPAPLGPGSSLLGFVRASIRAVPGGEVVVGLLVIFAVLGATWGLAQLHARLTTIERPGVAENFHQNTFIATLTACEDCHWSEAQAHLERATRLKPGRLDLRSGLAEITFDSGARVVLEGPALLDLYTPARANLSIGRVVARVPRAARGFTIDSPSVTVVDLGTEFGLDIDAAGCAEVHVFEGSVQAHPTATVAQGRTVLLQVAGLARFDVELGQSPAQLQATTFVRRVEDRASRPPLTLVEEGGSFAPGNLAQLKGAWAFGSNVLAGFPHHRIENLTDGHYGNLHSWIGASDAPAFVGVVLSGPSQIDSIAFGRDNSPADGTGSRRRTGQKEILPRAGSEAASSIPAQTAPAQAAPTSVGYRDRWQGTYTIQYSNAERTNQPPPEESWQTIDTLKYAPDMPEIASEHIHPYLRHRFRFAPVQATAVRIMTSQPGVCIDELEVYGARLPAKK